MAYIKNYKQFETENQLKIVQLENESEMLTKKLIGNGERVEKKQTSITYLTKDGNDSKNPTTIDFDEFANFFFFQRSTDQMILRQSDRIPANSGNGMNE